MLYTFLLVLLILDSLVLVAAILLQAGKGGGLAASFGGMSSSDSLIGTRQAGNLLTKTSWVSGGIFLFLAFVLQIASARTSAPSSVLDQLPATTRNAPAPPPAAAPAIPLENAPATPAPATPQPKQ